MCFLVASCSNAVETSRGGLQWQLDECAGYGSELLIEKPPDAPGAIVFVTPRPDMFIVRLNPVTMAVVHGGGLVRDGTLEYGEDQCLRGSLEFSEGVSEVDAKCISAALSKSICKTKELP